MKNMTSLMKVEIILMKRQAVYYLLSIGLPSVFYLIFSGMMSGSDIPEIALQAYLFAMTLFSIMSSAFFSIPSTLESDKTNNWQKLIQHSPVSMVEYYLIKVVGLFVDFLLSIGVVFTVGHVVRHVNMSLQDWVLSAFILILGSLAFVALGLVLTLLPSSQLMSVVGNLLYMGLAVMGGLWMPISLFPEWMQAIGKCLPTYQLMELIKTFLNKGQVNVFASVYLTLFTLVLFALVIVYRRHSEVCS